ncbi:MAG: RNA polymerase sigma factor [Bacillota bacterium]
MITDEELYRRLLSGDESSLEALVHRYHSPLLGFLYRQTGDRHLAEDLVQECFTRLVTYRGEPPRTFRAWAFTIAGNLARDHFRSAYRRREQADAMEEQGPVHLAEIEPGADELLLRDADRRAVVEALQLLSPSQREALILKFYHEMRVDEIAEVTGAPPGTVKSRLFHGLKQMKRHLSREGGSAHDGRADAQPGR